jgi:hypothetical protein
VRLVGTGRYDHINLFGKSKHVSTLVLPCLSCIASGFDEIKATLGANIQVPPWPPPFTIRGRHGGVAVWKMNLSRGRLKFKKGRMMTSLLWI